jgi:hypothetical protein
VNLDSDKVLLCSLYNYEFNGKNVDKPKVSWCFQLVVLIQVHFGSCTNKFLSYSREKDRLPRQLHLVLTIMVVRP